MDIGHFKISGHSTKRNWAVYLFIATPIKGKGIKKIYVGKVGDNRDGCNPVISRVGNHFSFNKIHSQIRNKILNTEKYNYDYYYCHLSEYEKDKIERKSSRLKTDEMERELKRIVEKRVNPEQFELINPYKGSHVSKSIRNERKKLISEYEKNMLELLCKKAL